MEETGRRKEGLSTWRIWSDEEACVRSYSYDMMTTHTCQSARCMDGWSVDGAADGVDVGLEDAVGGREECTMHTTMQATGSPALLRFRLHVHT